MNRRLTSFLGLFLFLTFAPAFAQGPTTAEPSALPSATRWEVDCSGFVSGTPLPKDLYVFDGADNDWHLSFRTFRTGDAVYLRNRGGGELAVGGDYILVRKAKETMRTPWYSGQSWALRGIGHAYEDVGKIKVLSLTPQGAVAQVTFSCGPVTPGDIAIPYQERAIPAYEPPKELDRFAMPNGKVWGLITAATSNAPYVAKGNTCYLDIGQRDGVRAGQRFRVFHVMRELWGGKIWPPRETPRETIGEAVILSVQEKSSVAMVVTSLREIAVGDGVELY